MFSRKKSGKMRKKCKWKMMKIEDHEDGARYVDYVVKTALKAFKDGRHGVFFREMFVKVKSVDPEVRILKMMSDTILHTYEQDV